MVRSMLSSMIKRLRILLGDDHALVLKGIRSLLEPYHDVVGAAVDGNALVQAASLLKPDLIVLDISMPLLNGLDAAQQIQRRVPNAKLIFVTMNASPMYLRRAIEAGACGYVLKTGAIEELLTAVETVRQGRLYVTPGFGPEVMESLWDRSGKIGREGTGLTARQREIMQLLSEGRLNKDIAHLLGISVKTVAFHRANLMARLGARSGAELARIAMEQGLIVASLSASA